MNKKRSRRKTKITGIMKKEEGPFWENGVEPVLTKERMTVTETSVIERKWKELLIFAIGREKQKIKQDLT